MANTNITALTEKLQMRLNDWTNTGAYEVDELEYCLNTAIRETEFLLKSNVYTTEFATSELTIIPPDANGLNEGAYYASSYAYVYEVWCNDAPLQRLSPADLSKLGSYESTLPDVPTKYWMNGSRVYLWPIPATSYNFKMSGMLISDDYTGTTDIVTLPTGISETLILDRAESEARRMRLMNSVNPSLHQVLYERWISMMQVVMK